MSDKKYLINEILQVCKVSNIAHDKHIPLDTVAINLATMTESELKKVAQELYIKTS